MSVMDISKRSPEELKRTQFEDNESAIQDAEFTVRTPEIVAAEIRQIADQTRKMVLNSSIEIGKRLCEAKEMVPHGEWAMPWHTKSITGYPMRWALALWGWRLAAASMRKIYTS